MASDTLIRRRKPAWLSCTPTESGAARPGPPGHPEFEIPPTSAFADQKASPSSSSFPHRSVQRLRPPHPSRCQTPHLPPRDDPCTVFRVLSTAQRLFVTIKTPVL